MLDVTTAAQTQHQRIVDAILGRGKAELILLFGSRARGDAREDSDYDIMLVLPDSADAERERLGASGALRAIGVSADVLTSGVSDYQRWQHDPGFLDWLVAREGLLLFTSGKVPRLSPSPQRVREGPREGLKMWIERAESDFRVAARSMAAADPECDGICFHSHACIEKLLKAMIVKRGIHPPQTHELPELLEAQPQGIREDAVVIGACARLQGLYPKSRYPEFAMPTSDEARVAFEAAQLVRARLLPLLSSWRALVD